MRRRRRVCVCLSAHVMSPAAVILAMPVATVALPPPPTQDSVASLDPAHDGSAPPYPVPSLPLHHARSCFRVYQRGPAGRPSPPPSPDAVLPPSASDNEVSDLLRGVGGTCLVDLFQLHQPRLGRRRRYPAELSCDSVVAAAPWQCVDHHDVEDDRELVQSSGDVSTVHDTASVMNAAVFYRPSLDFNKMQVQCTHSIGKVNRPYSTRERSRGAHLPVYSCEPVGG